MSLEIHLERNNVLVAQQNVLLTQLLQALSTGAVFSGVKPQQTHDAVVPDESDNATETQPTPPDVEALSFEMVIALAGFYPQQQAITTEQIDKATAYQSAVGAERIEQIDALTMALSNPPTKHLHKSVLLQLARAVLSHWEALTTISDRRAFAESWLAAAPEERHLVVPKPAKQNKSASTKGQTPDNSAIQTSATNEADSPTEPTPEAQRKQAEGLILQLAKNGYRAEAISILDQFGAKKLGQVSDADLAEVVAQAEKALEG